MLAGMAVGRLPLSTFRSESKVTALGAGMALTAYVAHALVIWVLAGPGGWIASNLAWALIAAGLFVFCLAWAALVGRGPLERITAASATWFAGPAADERHHATSRHAASRRATSRRSTGRLPDAR